MDRPPPPHPERRWTPLLGVLVVVAFVTFGGYVVAGPVTERAPPGPRSTEVLPGVAVTLPTGWANVGLLEVPVGDAGDILTGVRFNRGTGNVDVFSLTGFTGTPEELSLGYVLEVLQPAASRMQHSGDLDTFITNQGIRGARGFYLGTFPGVASPIEGELATVVAPDGIAVVLDGWAGTGQLVRWVEDIREIVRTMVVG